MTTIRQQTKCLIHQYAVSVFKHATLWPNLAFLPTVLALQYINKQSNQSIYSFLSSMWKWLLVILDDTEQLFLWFGEHHKHLRTGSPLPKGCDCIGMLLCTSKSTMFHKTQCNTCYGYIRGGTKTKTLLNLWHHAVCCFNAHMSSVVRLTDSVESKMLIVTAIYYCPEKERDCPVCPDWKFMYASMVLWLSETICVTWVNENVQRESVT